MDEISNHKKSLMYLFFRLQIVQKKLQLGCRVGMRLMGMVLDPEHSLGGENLLNLFPSDLLSKLFSFGIHLQHFIMNSE